MFQKILAACGGRWRFVAAVSLLLLTLAIPALVLIPHSAWLRHASLMTLSGHTILEFVGVQVCFSVFVVGWATHRNVRSIDTLLLSLTCGVVGWLDLGHTLSFKGMPAFVTPSGVNKALYFWLAGRLVSGFGFFAVSLSPSRFFNFSHQRAILGAGAVAIIMAAFVLILGYPEWLPVMFEEGVGLTTAKLTIEVMSIVLHLAAGLMFMRRHVREPASTFEILSCATLIFAMAGMFFTIYHNTDDLYNLVGHVYKAIGYVIVYRAVYVECVAKPYREARAAERSANEANVSKSRFLANVSHEFRTPLGVIRGFSDMLGQESGLSENARKWSVTISRNARQLNHLIDDLLDLSKAESDHIDIDLRGFAPSEAVEEIVSSLRLLASNKGIRIDFTSHLASGFRMRSDPLRFDQIMMNVIGNAVKFTPEGDVRVEIWARGNGVYVAVEDSGIGIDAEQVPRLFQPFAQAADPLRRHFGGTGLGLALSKKLSILLAGDLVLERSEPGRGSRFVIRIPDQPLVVSPSTRDHAVAAALVPGQLNDFRILAAEDSEDNRELLEIYLRPTGANVTFACDGREAVDLAHSGEYDLILMDIQMPEMDGFEAVSALRETGWNGPILALTAHAHPPERERAMRVGFSDYLVKPIVRETLIKKISSHHHPS